MEGKRISGLLLLLVPLLLEVLWLLWLLWMTSLGEGVEKRRISLSTADSDVGDDGKYEGSGGFGR